MKLFFQKAPAIRLRLAVSALFLFNLGPLPCCWSDQVLLPPPGQEVPLSQAFNPPLLKGIKIHPQNPFRFDFILEQGTGLSGPKLQQESARLIKYFLASLTIPQDEVWVNLSPYEKDRIIPSSFGLTGMGRDLLAEDYMLKQITASLIDPQGAIGRPFWKRVYSQAEKAFGTTDVPINTFNKVWIVPDRAVVYENAKAGTAYIVEAKLKVMLETDYLSMSKHQGQTGDMSPSRPPSMEALNVKAPQGKHRLPNENTGALGSQVMREIILPELKKEVNQGANFGRLRQVYNSLILADWYKNKVKDSLLNRIYSDQSKIIGVNVKDPLEKQRIYQRYLEAFRKGVYNYIREDQDPDTGLKVPRKYFSGGLNFGNFAMTVVSNGQDLPDAGTDRAMSVEALFSPIKNSGYGEQMGHQMAYFRDVWGAFRTRHKAVAVESLNSFDQKVSRRVWGPLLEALDAAIDRKPAQAKFMYNTLLLRTARRLLHADLEKNGWTILPRIRLILMRAFKGDRRLGAVYQAIDGVYKIHLLNDDFDPSKPLILFIRGVLYGSLDSFRAMFRGLKGDYNIAFFEYDELHPVEAATRLNQDLRQFFAPEKGIRTPIGIVGMSNGAIILRLAFAFAAQNQPHGVTRIFDQARYLEIVPPLAGSIKARSLRSSVARTVVRMTLLQRDVLYFHFPHNNQYQDLIDQYSGAFDRTVIREPPILAQDDDHNPQSTDPDRVHRARFEKLAGPHVHLIRGRHQDAANHPESVRIAMEFFGHLPKETLKGAVPETAHPEKDNRPRILLAAAVKKALQPPGPFPSGGIGPGRDNAMVNGTPEGHFIGYFLTEQQKSQFLDQIHRGNFHAGWQSAPVKVRILAPLGNSHERPGEHGPKANTFTFKNELIPGENFVFTKKNGHYTDIYFSSGRMLAYFNKLGINRTKLALFLVGFSGYIDEFTQKGERPEAALRLADQKIRRRNPEVIIRQFMAMTESTKGFDNGFIDHMTRELRQAAMIKEDLHPAAVFYGSARWEQESAERQAFAISQAGFSVDTGGGPGVMASGNRGAYKGKNGKGKTQSLGLRLYTPFEEEHNHFLDHVLAFHRFMSRKHVFLRLKTFMVNCYMGGLGTLDELFETLVEKETGEVDVHMPVHLVGEKNYRSLYNAIKDLYERGFIRHRPNELVTLVSDSPKADGKVLDRFKAYMAARRQKGYNSIFNNGTGAIDPEGIKQELLAVKRKLSALGPTIAVFGDQQKNASLGYEQMARQLGYQAAMDGYSLIVDLNDGSLGREVQKGFRRAREEKLEHGGEFLPELVDIGTQGADSDHEIHLNIKHKVVAYSVALMYPDQGSIYFPCGVKGLAAWFNQLDHIQVGKTRPTPQILIGREFWDRWRTVLEEYVHRWKTISAWSLDLSTQVGSVREAMSVLEGQKDKKWLYDWGRWQYLGALVNEIRTQNIRLLETRPIPIFEGTMNFIHQVYSYNQAGPSKIKLGVASSNPLTRVMLDNDDLSGYFDDIMDGRTVKQQHIPATPSPEFFKAAAVRLDADPRHTVVLEDAADGIASAAKGGFGLVIGINRGGNRKYLQEAGAHLVVNDISEINLEQIREKLAERTGSRKIEGIIFDNDGVIVDTEPLYFENIKAFMDDYFVYLSRKNQESKPLEMTWDDHTRYFRGRELAFAIKKFLQDRGAGLPSPEARRDLGGIDLEAKGLWAIQNNGKPITVHFDAAQLHQLQNAAGFTPVIINIQPITDLKLFLGLGETGPAARGQDTF